MQIVEENSHTTSNRASVSRFDTKQLQSALGEALGLCKFGRYDYILTEQDIPNIQKQLARALMKTTKVRNECDDALSYATSLVGDAVQCLVSDSFTECFRSYPDKAWNRTPTTFLLWCVGCVIRYFILLPFRTLVFFGSIVLLAGVLIVMKTVIPVKSVQQKVTTFLFWIFSRLLSFSYGTVIKQHGVPPKYKPGQIYVSNHTTVLDYCLLCSIRPFSIIGQLHKGVFGFVEKYLCTPIQPLWFNRADRTERANAAQKLRDHVFSENSVVPMLIFPEGCCVNNRFVVQFKKGAFDLGAEVIPIAIKYNQDISAAAYHNSKLMTAKRYLMSIFSQWALVCDVWFLAPEKIQPGETSVEFAHRVQGLIAKQAGLIPRQWDGLLKYVQVNEKMQAEAAKVHASNLGLLTLEDQGESSVEFSYTPAQQNQQ